jgi:hypothetical protein
MFTETKYAKKPFIPGQPRVSAERKKWVKMESANILKNNLVAREKTKDQMFIERSQRLEIVNKEREERLGKWLTKTKTSPFAVDLVAEDERIYEENQIRMREEKERERNVNERKARAKNDIILKALSEFSDLEALRKEKRAIMEEEQRLRALLTLEKLTVDNKSDRLAAERAQRQRAYAKSTHRRDLYKDSLDQIVAEEQEHLRLKHGLPDQSVSKEFRISLERRFDGSFAV